MENANNTSPVFVTKPSMPPYEEYIEEIKQIWDAQWLTNFGAIHNKFKEQLKVFLRAENISLFTNGHMALYSAIVTLGLKGEIITTPYTFASTTHAIVQAGCTPVFCDINPYTFTIDADKIEALITNKTCAIIPVHVYGVVCDIEKINRIAKKYNLKIIYDAAHAFGVNYKEKGIGTYGDCSMFSFHATKAFNSIEGGALAYNDSRYAKPLKEFKNFGLVDGENINETGTNAKMNEFQAAMGICNLRHINDVIAKRKRLTEIYRSAFKDFPGVKLLPVQENVQTNYAYFPAVFDTDNGCPIDRDSVKAELEKHNIFARRYFYPITADFPCYKVFRDRNDTPIARDISNKVLSLPLYADLETEDAERICSIIKGMI
ncbi:MAG: DegT/DnrJ/EryC1/StrS family aminotransferase [Ruminococcaceae bacterium]|nr:DegT/DnrJ/EryC1/StrS family aminotransferase [Oscillospiraceae bacterium]